MTELARRGLIPSHEFSMRTGIPESLLARWRSQRRVLDFVKIGGRAFYRRADVEGLIERNTVRAVNGRLAA